MDILYLDCGMGAAGDMLMAALLELHPDPAGFLSRLNGLGLPGIEVTARKAQKCGIQGTSVSVKIYGQEEGQEGPGHHEHQGHHGPSAHHHTSIADIRRILAELPVSQRVRDNAQTVYHLIAQAEAKVHGVPMEHIHFHEVGTLDAVADVVGVCMLLDELGADRVLASPVCVGSGTVRCAHGVLPVPAPATAELLRGIPIYAGTIQAELCTPTGAALLRHFVEDFGPMPAIRPRAWSCGMGTRDFETANCLRAVLGTLEEAAGEQVWELACNLDDMTGEDIAFACQRLLGAGALDVWTTAIGMKKGRPGILLSCLCREAERPALTDLLLRYTTTLGVRSRQWERHVLPRRQETRETPLGPLAYKLAEGEGFHREKPEYEDLARLAQERGWTLEQVRRAIQQ